MSQDWQTQLKLILDYPRFATPEDVTPELFKARLEELGADLSIPGVLQAGLNQFFESEEGTDFPLEDSQQATAWKSFISDVWALAYLDHHNDREQEMRWLKAYPAEKWATALPEEKRDKITPEELNRLRQRFVYRNVAAHYEQAFNWRSTMFPGWII